MSKNPEEYGNENDRKRKIGLAIGARKGDVIEYYESDSKEGYSLNPQEISVRKYKTDNVYVVDRHNNRIQKFDSDGNFITKWGSNGTGDGQLYDPVSIVVDSSDNVYVAYGVNIRIQVFAPSYSE